MMSRFFKKPPVVINETFGYPVIHPVQLTPDAPLLYLYFATRSLTPSTMPADKCAAACGVWFTLLANPLDDGYHFGFYSMAAYVTAKRLKLSELDIDTANVALHALMLSCLPKYWDGVIYAEDPFFSKFMSSQHGQPVQREIMGYHRIRDVVYDRWQTAVKDNELPFISTRTFGARADSGHQKFTRTLMNAALFDFTTETDRKLGLDCVQK